MEENVLCKIVFAAGIIFCVIFNWIKSIVDLGCINKVKTYEELKGKILYKDLKNAAEVSTSRRIYFL